MLTVKDKHVVVGADFAGHPSKKPSKPTSKSAGGPSPT